MREVSRNLKKGTIVNKGADAHLRDAAKAVVAALVAPPVDDVTMEVPHLYRGIPEGRHGDVRAAEDVSCHLIVQSLQDRPQLWVHS